MAATSASQPQSAITSTPDGRGDVIPFPCHGVPMGSVSSDRWEFQTEVRYVDGSEADWLRRELAAVLRALLVWARDDQVNCADRRGQAA